MVVNIYKSFIQSTLKKTPNSSTVWIEEHIKSNKAVLQHIFLSHNLQKYSEVE